MSSPYSSLLTSPDDSEIDAIISEITDLCVLEQIAALNTAHLPPADLPAEIESRFRNLKTFPQTNRRSNRPPHCSVDDEDDDDPTPAPPIQPVKVTDPDPQISVSASPKPDLCHGTRRSRSPSPTRAICCFWCSQKKMVRRRTVEHGDEIFVDFGAEKMRERRKKMERVLREQEMASREAEKMVEMMEETAARLNREALDEILIDYGLKKFK